MGENHLCMYFEEKLLLLRKNKTPKPQYQNFREIRSFGQTDAQERRRTKIIINDKQNHKGKYWQKKPNSENNNPKRTRPKPSRPWASPPGRGQDVHLSSVEFTVFVFVISSFSETGKTILEEAELGEQCSQKAL